MELQFIDNSTALPKQSRKLIRSHVMKRKNQGKRFADRGWKGRNRLIEVAATTAGGNGLSDGPETIQEIRSAYDVTRVFSVPDEPAEGPYLFNPFAGYEYAYFTFPTRLTNAMRCMIFQFHAFVHNEVYPNHFCSPPGATGAQSPWFKPLVTDEAFFHTLFVVTGTYLQLLYGQNPQSVAALEAPRHFAQSIYLINRDLSSSTELKPSTIAVVTSLTIHANLTGALKESRVHLDGLTRMVNLFSGGLSGLRDNNSPLVQKICRTDIEVALREGTVTKFGSDPAMIRAAASASARLNANGRSGVRLDGPLIRPCATLQYIIKDILALCECARDGWQKLEPHEYQDAVITVFHRLIGFSPLRDSRPLPLLDDTWHIGLLAFMTTIFHAHVTHRALYSDILTHKLRSHLLDEELAKDTQDQRFRFWLFFVYNLCMPENFDGRWLVPQVTMLIQQLKFTSWAQAKASLGNFPWIDLLHDPPSRKLWELAMPEMENPESVKYLAVGI